MSFLVELKRRNVVRVAIAYAAVAWLVVQLVETVLPVFGVSDQAIRLIFIALAVGFIPALVFSWVFEITPEGIKRESQVDRSRSITPATGRKLDRVIVAVLGIAVTYFVVDKFIVDPQRDAAELERVREQALEEGRTAALQTEAPPNSIAVLPFLNMSNDADNESFTDGVSEELLNLLAQAGGLVVVSRTSSFYFKGKDVDIPQVAERLNVRHVLEGSVRRAGSKVRVTAQLIDAQSDSHLWSQTFDRELDDIFAVQDEIARHIVAQLRDRLDAVIGEPQALGQTRSLEAYQYNLRGLNLLRLRGIQNIRQSIELFEKAIAADPNYARAHANQAMALFLTPFYDDLPRPPWFEKAERAARRAMALDPAMASPYSTLASIYQYTGEPSSKTDQTFRRAIELEPNDVTARQWYGEFLMKLGKVRELRQQMERAHQLDPLAPVINAALAWAYLYNGDFERAERFAATALDLGMGGTWAEDVLGLVYLHWRDYDKALAVFARDHPDFALNRLVVQAARDPALVPQAMAAIDAVDYARISYWPVELVMLLGQVDEAFSRALAQARRGEGDERAIWRPHFVAHAHRPEFTELVTLYGFPEYYRATGWPDYCRPQGEYFTCSAAFYSQAD